MYPDDGSQLVEGSKTMELSFTDVKGRLNKEYGVAFNISPVGANYIHGKVERKILEIKKSIEVTMQGKRIMSI